MVKFSRIIILVLFVILAAKGRARALETSNFLPTVFNQREIIAQPVSSLSTKAPIASDFDDFIVEGNLDSFARNVRPQTETLFIREYMGKLYASTGQWESTRTTGAQVLVKDEPASLWYSFKNFAVVRAQALDSIVVPAEFNNGVAAQVLLAWGRNYLQIDRFNSSEIGERRRVWPKGIYWMTDEQDGFDASFPIDNNEIRAFGSLAEDDEFAFYAGLNPEGIIRGVWDTERESILWDGDPELVIVDDPREGYAIEGKVTGFAGCGGDLYTTVNDTLYKRSTSSGQWSQLFSGPDLGEIDSGFRGLTCINDSEGQPALLLSIEGPGKIFRLENLSGQITPRIEFDVREAVTTALRRAGIPIPDSGVGSVSYVIAAYNRFAPITINGKVIHMFGVEWDYAGQGSCPPGTPCQPGDRFDAEACFFIRDAVTSSKLRYIFNCLGGEDFIPRPDNEPPVTFGEAFVAVRTVQQSPWDASKIFVGGYDANFIPSFGTAWIGSFDINNLPVNANNTFIP